MTANQELNRNLQLVRFAANPNDEQYQIGCKTAKIVQCGARTRLCSVFVRVKDAVCFDNLHHSSGNEHISITDIVYYFFFSPMCCRFFYLFYLFYFIGCRSRFQAEIGWLKFKKKRSFLRIISIVSISRPIVERILNFIILHN